MRIFYFSFVGPEDSKARTKNAFNIYNKNKYEIIYPKQQRENESRRI